MSYLIEAKTKKGSVVKAQEICEWANTAIEVFSFCVKEYPECNVNAYRLTDVTEEFTGGVK